jgi:hypothetical protein
MCAVAGLLVHMVWLATDIDWRIRIACSWASAVVTQYKGLRMNETVGACFVCQASSQRHSFPYCPDAHVRPLAKPRCAWALLLMY